MKSRTIIGFVIFTLFLFQNLYCNKENISQNVKKYKFALVTGLGGLGDKAFNDMQYKGMMMAKKKYGITFDYTAPKTESDDIFEMEKFISKGYNVVIAGGGYHMREPVDILSKKYPDVIFIIVDDHAINYRKNVASITFKQNEGSFLAGALAAMVSKTGKIGVIGGISIPVINDFIVAYEQGAKYVNKNIQVVKSYISNGNDNIFPWDNPRVAKKLAEEMYANDVDIIFSVASASGLGVYSAAKENKKFAIGVDSDQDYLAEGSILTSMMKNLDIGILYVIEKILKGEFENKAYVFGLKENGVGLTEMQYTKQYVSNDVLKTINDIKNKIILNKIKVPSQIK